MTAPAGPQWPCEAYGPEGLDVGGLCFIAGNLDGARVCTDPAACHQAMTAERQRVYDRITTGAAAADPTAQYLAGVFTTPASLLGGGDLPADEQLPAAADPPGEQHPDTT